MGQKGGTGRRFAEVEGLLCGFCFRKIKYERMLWVKGHKRKMHVKWCQT
jgi:hypothetical protein